MKPVSIFISYSHKDENFRNELGTHLRVLERTGIVTSWHDRRILPGSDWSREIDQHIEQADIFLCLVSADFFDSDYCWEREMKRALVRHSAGQTVVIPILIKPVAWGKTADVLTAENLLKARRMCEAFDEHAEACAA